MGFKASMILVKDPAGTVPADRLLESLGFKGYDLKGDITLEECIYPRDRSVSIGYYNGCLIICEDYMLTTEMETTGNARPDQLLKYEQVLTALFPGAEVLTIACHSGVNYHLYALAKDGLRVRYKCISSDTPLIEWGDRLEEEKTIYEDAGMMDGERRFQDPGKKDGVYEYTEDQLMEDFTFGVAKRHLGVRIDRDEGEELNFEIIFQQYVRPAGSFPKGTSDTQRTIKTNHDLLAEAQRKASKEDGMEDDDDDEKVPDKKPWWKIW